MTEELPELPPEDPLEPEPLDPPELLKLEPPPEPWELVADPLLGLEDDVAGALDVVTVVTQTFVVVGVFVVVVVVEPLEDVVVSGGAASVVGGAVVVVGGAVETGGAVVVVVVVVHFVVVPLVPAPLPPEPDFEPEAAATRADVEAVVGVAKSTNASEAEPAGAEATTSALPTAVVGVVV